MAEVETGIQEVAEENGQQEEEIEGGEFVVVDTDGDQASAVQEDEEGVEVKEEEKEHDEPEVEQFQTVDSAEPGEDGNESETHDQIEHTTEGETSNIEGLVTKALESKLEGFQAQMQQMLAVMQLTAAGKSALPSKKGDGGETGGDVASTVEEMDDGEEGDEKQPGEGQGEKKVADKPKVNKPPTKNDIERVLWREFLATVSDILDLPTSAEEKEKSVLDDTVATETEKKSVSYLPADSVVKEQWQKANEAMKDGYGGLSKMKTRQYFWPVEDMNAFGRIPRTNNDVMMYLKGPFKKRGDGLPEQSSKVNGDIRKTEGYLRYQQRIISYTNYIVAALRKVVKGEKEAEEGTVDKMFENLEKCLTDICDTSVQASVVSVRGMRRIHMEAMGMKVRSVVPELLNMRLSNQLFQDDIKAVLKKHGFPLRVGPHPGGQKVMQSASGPGQKSDRGRVKVAPSGGSGGIPRSGGASRGRGGSNRQPANRSARPRPSKQAPRPVDVGRRNIGRGGRRDGPNFGGGGNSRQDFPRSGAGGTQGQGGKRRPPPSSGPSRNAKRRKERDFTSDRYDSQYTPYSDNLFPSGGGMGFSGMPRLASDMGGSSDPSMYTDYGSSDKSMLTDYGASSSGSMYPSSSNLGGGYYRPGDTSSFLGGYMSFTDPGSSYADHNAGPNMRSVEDTINLY